MRGPLWSQLRLVPRLTPVLQVIRFTGLQDHPTPTPTVSNDSKPRKTAGFEAVSTGPV
ncbi:hypothetical protein GCM10022247_61870 [Allokutzneria multivorans]|uniref:Uncharacterized protein n=1 Tax=Allokutzneria multivorans TaxID=1142134 RepID=A0ABP7TNB8_9PSEU